MRDFIVPDGCNRCFCSRHEELPGGGLRCKQCGLQELVAVDLGPDLDEEDTTPPGAGIMAWLPRSWQEEISRRRRADDSSPPDEANLSDKDVKHDFTMVASYASGCVSDPIVVAHYHCSCSETDCPKQGRSGAEPGTGSGDGTKP